jgi:(R)-2-hydroxyacyl-CoA dehydratese activating ATPase
MTSAGIDIGSRTIKLVVCEDDKMVISKKRENSFHTLSVCDELLCDIKYESITATGYGRHLFKRNHDAQVISEIKAFAIGARKVFPSCRTILDIGGQDIKAISLDQAGCLRKFEMNDKCSAGTGKFLEIMAMALGFELTEFGKAAMCAPKAEKINSMCTVFAESEVVSMVARGASRDEVALGLLQSIVIRARSMLSRVQIENDFVFVGGVAFNPCVKKLLEESLLKVVRIPDDPQIIGAYGCALYGNNVK